MAQITTGPPDIQDVISQSSASRQPPTPQQGLQQGLSIGPSSPGPSSTGFKKTFYKRKLPCPPAIEFSSPDGRLLFQEALLEGSMVGFFKLMEQFNTQDEPAFCGLASLAMVLNALSIDPRRTWKGSWRWFHEAMLDCCRPLDTVKEEGITLYQASCLARCNGARVEVRPYGSTSLEQFRQEVEAVCRSGEEHIVVSYSRKAFLQTGDGHFSPIGGYHRERDLALVLDVARFKYPPHWVPLPMLYHAMSYLDPETGRPRGYMRLASNPLLDSVLLTLDVRSDGWRPADRFIRTEAPALVQDLATRGGLSAEDVLRQLMDAMPLASLDAFLVVRSGAPLAAAASASAATPTAGESAAAQPSLTGTTDSPTTSGGSGAPGCQTLEAMAAAAKRASRVGSAAAADAAATANACASASSSPTAPADGSDAQPPSFDAAPSAPSHGLARSTGTGKSCGVGSDTAAGKGCGSSSCGGGGPAASSCGGGGSAGGSTPASLMAAATAVFIAQDRCIPQAQRQQLLDELRVMPLYHLVSNHLAATAKASTTALHGPAAAAAPAPSAEPPPAAVAPLPGPGGAAGPAGGYLVEKVVMALLMQRPEAWPGAGAWGEPAAGVQWRALLGLAGYSVVEAEVSYLREQLLHIDEVLQSGDINGTCGEHSSRLDCAAHGH